MNSFAKKIAIMHPKLGWGGSEATVFWMIEALKNNYKITLITSGKIDILKINNYYGTNLKPEDFSVIDVSMPFFLKGTDKFAALRGRFIQRYCQRVAKQFDLIVSAYNPCNFKTKGIQIATDMQKLPEIMELKNFKKQFYGDSLLRRLYLKLCDLVSPDNIEGWNSNLTLSNSNWTAQLMRQRYKIDSKTLYPPVVGNFPVVDFAKKERGFVCLGRVVSEKGFDKIIDILDKVRNRGNNIHLHIIGKLDNSPHCRFLKKKCFGKNWVILEDNLSQEKKNQLVSNHRFAISARNSEPFGIAVAEMVKAGCITFVPDGGGQTEIVNNSNLIFRNEEDAVSKIEAVIKNQELQKEVLKQLSENSQKFSIENFKKEVIEIINNWFL
jgi:glycosyltransferase involved in cell wall biosynthesis